MELKHMKIVNKKARFNYEISERIEAGIQLTGAEVKSVRLGQVNMDNAYVKIMPSRFRGQNETWVTGLQIFPYKHADNKDYDPGRTRKLLLHQKEVVTLQSRMKQARLMLVPTAMYTKSGFIKMEVGLARGKKKYEKREAIKKRDLERAGE